MNENDLTEFEEKNPELQMKYLESIGLANADILIQAKKLESSGYWDFVFEEYNNRMCGNI